MRILRGLVIAALICVASAPSHAQEARKPCFIKGIEIEVICVSITVPLDYDEPDGETIALGAAIVPATTARPAADALFVFAGGPGQAATDLGSMVATAFRSVRQRRDIVLFDIRGTGRSSALSCSFTTASVADVEAVALRETQACAAALGPRVRHFTSKEIVADIEAMRRALGLSKISLWGGSFGTRIAQHYIRRHGSHVHAAVLDAPTSVTDSIFLSAPLAAQEAMDAMIVSCKAQADCARSFPALEADFSRLMARLAATPVAVRMRDPKSGAPADIVWTRDMAAGIVRGALYADLPQRVLPFAIHQAAQGEFQPLLALGSLTAEWSIETMSVPTMLSILCAEDYVRAKAQSPGAQDSNPFGAAYSGFFGVACPHWPSKPLPKDMFSGFKALTPVVVIAGDRDPVTPPSAGVLTLENFPAGRLAVVRNGFHTNSAYPCIARMIGAFLDEAATLSRYAHCLELSAARYLTSANF